jgi:hypothetical protein
MSTGLMLGIGLTVLVVGVLIAAAAWSMSERRVLERQLRETPAVTAAGLEVGSKGRLAGVVTSDATLRAPLTGRPCVAYVACVEEKRSDRTTSPWVERIHEVRGVPFTLDDGTGRALVDPAHSTLLLHMDSTTRSGVFDGATPVEASFLARHGMESTGWFLNKTLRYTEGIIEPGERVAVIGHAAREPAADATDPYGSLTTRVRIAGTPELPILVTDRKDLVGG